MADNRTLTGVLKQAALEGFASHIFLFDGGHTVTLTQPGVPDFRVTTMWGEEDRAIGAIQTYVSTNRRRREDDPATQHEGPYLDD